MPASPKRAGGGWAAIPRSLRPVPLACTVFLILSATALVGMVWRTPTIDSDGSPPLVRVADVIGAGQQGGQDVQLSPALLPLRPELEARSPVQIQALEPRGHLRPSVNVDEDFCAMVPAGEWGEGGGPPDPSVAVAPLWYNVTVTGEGVSPQSGSGQWALQQTASVPKPSLPIHWANVHTPWSPCVRTCLC